MQIKTSDLPGIGKRYSFITSGKEYFVVILHQAGNREIYHFLNEDDDEPDFSINLTDDEARQLGVLLMGVDYQPVADDRMELLLKEFRIEWIKVSPDSCLANKSIIESSIRSVTGSTIIGIQRGDEIIGSPDVEEVILPGDILMAIGKREQVNKLAHLCEYSW
jgi:TrkA domain protein